RGLGKLLHRTATMAFCEGSVIDDAGRLCAHATGTFKFLKALPARDRALPRGDGKGAGSSGTPCHSGPARERPGARPEIRCLTDNR
ncbi:MAG: hypothetical protein ABW005_11255, partial [Burkholderiaceae bacterium]